MSPSNILGPAFSRLSLSEKKMRDNRLLGTDAQQQVAASQHLLRVGQRQR